MPEGGDATSGNNLVDWVWVNMGSSVDFLLNLNTSCVDCWDQGPPPNMILSIPPPPLPVFLQRAFNNNNNADPCTIQCDWNSATAPGVEYVEMPRQVVTGPAMDDTWLLVLIASCVTVLLLGSLLALFLLKSRVERSGKTGMQLDVSPPPTKPKGSKGCEAVLYPCPSPHAVVAPDSRVLWAALTPRGTTQHFTAEPLPHKFITPLPLSLKPSAGGGVPAPQIHPQLVDVPAFDNSGFVDSDDPTYAEPLTPIYCEPILLTELATLKRGGSPRPRVSSPTRIENPNLPPLNLHPHRSLRRSTLSRRGSDVSQCPAVL